MSKPIFTLMGDEEEVDGAELEYLVEEALNVAKSAQRDISFRFGGVDITLSWDVTPIYAYLKICEWMAENPSLEWIHIGKYSISSKSKPPGLCPF